MGTGYLRTIPQGACAESRVLDVPARAARPAALTRRSRIESASRGRVRATRTAHITVALAGIALLPAVAAAAPGSAAPSTDPTVREQLIRATLKHQGEELTVAQHRVRSVSLRRQLVRTALSFRGTPYVWGGSTPAGFDCSGFTAYVYARFGTRMAHSTYAQYAAYRRIPRNRLQPGDLVFFSSLGHMGIYIGRGRFVHSPRSGKHVEVQRLSGSWYRTSYVGAVRPPIHAPRPPLRAR